MQKGMCTLVPFFVQMQEIIKHLVVRAEILSLVKLTVGHWHDLHIFSIIYLLSITGDGDDRGSRPIEVDRRCTYKPRMPHLSNDEAIISMLSSNKNQLERVSLICFACPHAKSCM